MQEEDAQNTPPAQQHQGLHRAPPELHDSDDMCRTDGSPMFPSDDLRLSSRLSAAARVKTRLAAAAAT